jgi:hypothetical protein
MPVLSRTQKEMQNRAGIEMDRNDLVVLLFFQRCMAKLFFQQS